MCEYVCFMFMGGMHKTWSKKFSWTNLVTHWQNALKYKKALFNMYGLCQQNDNKYAHLHWNLYTTLSPSHPHSLSPSVPLSHSLSLSSLSVLLNGKTDIFDHFSLFIFFCRCDFGFAALGVMESLEDLMVPGGVLKVTSTSAASSFNTWNLPLGVLTISGTGDCSTCWSRDTWCC